MEKVFNVLELASELADLKLRETFNGDIDIETETEVRYTEEAQDYFNELYDEYYDFLINTNTMENWIKQLEPIIKEWKGGDEEPLDGDSVDRLTEIIKAKINLNEGNITEEEYNEILY